MRLRHVSTGLALPRAPDRRGRKLAPREGDEPLM
jgi:hypothetical protein